MDAAARASAIAAQVRAKESSLVDEISAIDPGWAAFVADKRKHFGGTFAAWWVALDDRELRSKAPMREGTWVPLSPRTNNQ